MWWWTLLSPPAAATCFCSHSKTPTRIISKYLQYAYWPWGICLVNFFFAFFSFFNKIQDNRQNPMAHARAQTASSICYMFRLKEKPYPGRELKSFWCPVIFWGHFSAFSANSKMAAKIICRLNRFLNLFYVWFKEKTSCADYFLV